MPDVFKRPTPFLLVAQEEPIDAVRARHLMVPVDETVRLAPLHELRRGQLRAHDLVAAVLAELDEEVDLGEVEAARLVEQALELAGRAGRRDAAASTRLLDRRGALLPRPERA